MRIYSLGQDDDGVAIEAASTARAFVSAAMMAMGLQDVACGQHGAMAGARARHEGEAYGRFSRARRESDERGRPSASSFMPR